LNKLFFTGIDAIRDYTKKHTGKPLEGTDEDITKAIDNNLAHYFHSPTNTTIDTTARQIAEALEVEPPTEWHTYEELPDDLTAYDLLATARDRDTQLATIKADFPDVYTALHNYITAHIPQAQNLKPNQLDHHITTRGELTDAGIIGTQPTDNDILQLTPKPRRTGIAIIDNPQPGQTDDNGDYKHTNLPLQQLRANYSKSNIPKRQSQISIYTNYCIYPALRKMYAYNALLQILEKVYKIKDLAETAKAETEHLEQHIDTLNKQLFDAYADAYGDNEDTRQDRRNAIKQIFCPIERNGLKPTDSALKTIKNKLIKQGFTADSYVQLIKLYQLIEQLSESSKEALKK
jgi:hypothetical protein